MSALPRRSCSRARAESCREASSSMERFQPSVVRRSETYGRKIQLSGAFHRCECDCEVLDRQACRIEDGDVLVRLAAFRRTDQDVAELRDVGPGQDACFDAVNELAVV